MRISDWSSDVCSSDLPGGRIAAEFRPVDEGEAAGNGAGARTRADRRGVARRGGNTAAPRRPRPHFRSASGGSFRQLYSGRYRRPHDTREPEDHADRSEEHTSELQSLMRISYAVFCLKKKNNRKNTSNKQIYNQTRI